MSKENINFNTLCLYVCIYVESHNFSTIKKYCTTPKILTGKMSANYYFSIKICTGDHCDIFICEVVKMGCHYNLMYCLAPPTILQANSRLKVSRSSSIQETGHLKQFVQHRKVSHRIEPTQKSPAKCIQAYTSCPLRLKTAVVKLVNVDTGN